MPHDTSIADSTDTELSDAIGEIAEDIWAPNGIPTASPSSLVFESLPIGSWRPAVFGHFPDLELCATVVWFMSAKPDEIPMCAPFSSDVSETYVVITAATEPPCTAWDYSANTDLLSIEGCVDFAEFGGESADRIQITIQVESPLYTGPLRFEAGTF